MKKTGWLVLCLCVAWLLTALAGIAGADVPVPDPKTHWPRGQEPAQKSIVIAGGSFSAAVIAAGLLLVLSPLGKSAAAKGIIGVASLLGLAAIAGVAWSYSKLANQDRAAWQQWKIDEADRRSRWQGPPPPDFPVPPIPSESPPSATEPTFEPPALAPAEPTFEPPALAPAEPTATEPAAPPP